MWHERLQFIEQCLPSHIAKMLFIWVHMMASKLHYAKQWYIGQSGEQKPAGKKLLASSGKLLWGVCLSMSIQSTKKKIGNFGNHWNNSNRYEPLILELPNLASLTSAINCTLPHFVHHLLRHSTFGFSTSYLREIAWSLISFSTDSRTTHCFAESTSKCRITVKFSRSFASCIVLSLYLATRFWIILKNMLEASRKIVFTSLVNGVWNSDD